MADDLRARIDDALQESMDRCARCKACDAQVDAVMAVIAGLVQQLPEGTRTRWGVRYARDVAGEPRPYVQLYMDEDTARAAAAQVTELDPGETAAVMCCQVTPWTEAPVPRDGAADG